MKRQLFSVCFLVVTSGRVDAACIDPAALAHSTKSITRHFEHEEKAARPGVFGISGTGWFLSPTLMVTIGHVAASMNLSDQTWKPIEIREGESKQSIPVRI